MLELLIAAPSTNIEALLKQHAEQDHYRLYGVNTVSDCIQAANQLFDSLSAAIVADDLNGADVYEAVTHLHQMSIPVIMIAPPERTAAAYAAGADDVLTWPQSPLLIERRLHNLLETRDLRANAVRDSWYRGLVENDLIGIIRTNMEGQFLFANRGIARMLGYDSELDLLRLNIARDFYVNADERRQIIQDMMNVSADNRRHFTQELMNNRAMMSRDVLFKRKDGSTLPVTISVHPHFNPDGSIRHFDVVIIDNNQRYQAQVAERNARQFADTLREVINTLNTSLEIEDVLDKIIMGVSLLLPGVSVAIIQITGEEWQLTRQYGIPNQTDDSASQNLRRSLHTRPGLKRIAESARAAVISHTRTHPDWIKNPDSDWIESYIGLPIISHERVIGIMNLNSSTPGSLTGEIAARIQTFADQAAIALDNAYTVRQLRAEIEERQRAEAAEREQRQLAEALREAATIISSHLNLNEVLDRIMDMLTRIMPLDVVNIMLIENGYARSVRSIGYDRYGVAEEVAALALPVQDTANMREMVETHRPYVIPDTHQYAGWVDTRVDYWIRSIASAPILVHNEVIGFLVIDSNQPGAFTQADAERLQAFANQVGIAIENARLYEAVQQHNRELEARVAERTVELEQKRAELVAILDSIQEGVVGTIFVPGTREVAERHVNTTLVKMFGYSADEWDVHKLRIDEMSLEEFEKALQNVRDTAHQKGAYQNIHQFRRKDGSTFEASATLTNINNSAGHLIGSVTVYRDVSQERELQARQARFVAAAAHELRNPLTAFKTRLDLAQRKPQDMERHLRLLTEISNNMERLVTDLLNQNRFERGVIEIQPVAIELQPLLQQVQTLLAPEAERKQITLQTDIPPEPLVVLGDADRLHQVITNLTVNAIAYSPDRSAVTLRLRRVNDGQVLVQVEDTGTGIAPEHLPHLFEPFYRIRKVGQGMGLGLSITREIVELHGGTISADSEIGRGTCFNVRLPVAPQ
jgi:PAS domain S-box-containing protein